MSDIYCCNDIAVVIVRIIRQILITRNNISDIDYEKRMVNIACIINECQKTVHKLWLH